MKGGLLAGIRGADEAADIHTAIFFAFVCAHAPDVHYNDDRGANFAAYKSYQRADLPGPGAAVPDQLIGRSIKRAIDEQLEQKGLAKVEMEGDLQNG